VIVLVLVAVLGFWSLVRWNEYGDEDEDG